MKIGFISLNQFLPTFNGGSNALWDIMTHLARNGQETDFLFFVARNSDIVKNGFLHVLQDAGGQLTAVDEESFDLSIGQLNVHHRVLPYVLGGRKQASGDLLKSVREEILLNRPDYVFTIDDCGISLLASCLAGIPGGHIFNSVANVLSFKSLNPMFANLLKTRDVIAVSGFLQMRIKEWLGVESSRWPPFIDLERYRASGTENTAAEAIGFCGGGFVHYKGDEVFNEIAKCMKDFSFLVVGEKYLEPPGPRPRNLEYMGRLSDMRAFYQKIKLLLVPSIVPEGHSRVIIEAASNGVPSIASNAGGIPEALGGSGVLIDIGSLDSIDIKNIAMKYVCEIRKLLGNETVYQDQSRRSLERARSYQAEQVQICEQFLKGLHSRLNPAKSGSPMREAGHSA
jgi:glycosyltransferase involved in cell wall biosynthesis